MSPRIVANLSLWRLHDQVAVMISLEEVIYLGNPDNAWIGNAMGELVVLASCGVTRPDFTTAPEKCLRAVARLPRWISPESLYKAQLEPLEVTTMRSS